MHDLSILHMQLHIMFFSQYKQNSILWYDTLCDHSGWPAVRVGIFREYKEENFLKVSQGKSKNGKEFGKKSARFVRKFQGKLNCNW